MKDLAKLKELDDHLIDLQGAQLERAWIGIERLSNYTSRFLEMGFAEYELSDALAQDLRGFFDPDLRIPFEVGDCADHFWGAPLPPSTVEKLNQTHHYFARPAYQTEKALVKFLYDNAQALEAELGCHFKITNVRAVASLPTGDFGPTSWHFDGSAKFLRKILIYPQAMDPETGSIEIFDRQGASAVINSREGVALLCDTSILLHRGRPGSDNAAPRPMIEVTLAPSNITSLELVFAGQNARVPKVDVKALPLALQEVHNSLATAIQSGQFDRRPKSRWSKKALLARAKKSINKRLTSRKSGPQKIWNMAGKVNLGGGPNFMHKGWLNFDGVDRASVSSNVEFSGQTVLPVSTRTAALVYSSHCLEHLDDATVQQLLKESRRIVSADGDLLLKIPDFSKALDRYNADDSSYFEGQWAIEAVASNWKSKGVIDGIAARAAFLFFGYWNKSFGNPFASGSVRSSDAYHGPIPMETAGYERVLAHGDPRMIVSLFREHAGLLNDLGGYNHCNAWGREQFAELVEECGFKVHSNDSRQICDHFADVPGVEQMFDITQYLWAKPSN